MGNVKAMLPSPSRSVAGGLAPRLTPAETLSGVRRLKVALTNVLDGSAPLATTISGAPWTGITNSTEVTTVAEIVSWPVALPGDD